MITWPTDIISTAVDFYIRHNTTVFESPLTGVQQTLRRLGERWVASYSFTCDRANGQRMDALLASARGSFDTFAMWDHSRPTPSGDNRDRGGVAETFFSDITDFDDATQFFGGADVAHVLGTQLMGSQSLVTDGWYPSVTVLKAGDYFEVAGRLYMLTADALSSAIGRATLTFAPRLRADVTNGALLTRTRATTPMRLIDDGQPARRFTPNVYDYNLSFVEDL